MKRFFVALIFLLIVASPALAEVIGVTVHSDIKGYSSDIIAKCIVNAIEKPGKYYVKLLPEIGSFNPKKLAKIGGKERIDVIWRYAFFEKDDAPHLEMTIFRVGPRTVETTLVQKLDFTKGRPCSLAIDITWAMLEAKLSQTSIGYLNGARGFAEAQRFEEASEQYAKAAQYTPDAGSIYREFGQYLEGAGRNDWAIEVYKTAANIDEHEVTSYLRIAEIYRAEGKFEEAAHYIELALDRGPKNPATLMVLGNSYSAIEQWELAWRAMLDAQKMDPENIDELKPLIQALKEDKQFAQAAAFQKQYVDNRPDDLIAVRDLLEIYMEAEDYRAAEFMLSSFVKARPNESYWIEQLGIALVGLQDYKGAKEQFERLLKLKPDNMSAHSQLAELAYRQRDFKTAKHHLDWALSQVPGHVEALRLMARIQEMEQDYEGALQSQKLVILYEEGMPDADLMRLFAVGKKAGRIDLVDQAVNELIAVKRGPDRRRLVMALAETMIAQGQKEKALNFLRNRKRMIVKHPPAVLLLGKLLVEQQDIEGARDLFRQAIFFSPDEKLPAAAGTIFHEMDLFDDAEFFFLFAKNRNEQSPKHQLQYLEAALLNEDVDAGIWPILAVNEMQLSPLYRQYFLFLELIYARLKPDDEFYNRVYPYAMQTLEKGVSNRLDLSDFNGLIKKRFQGKEQEDLLDLVKLFEGKMSLGEYKKAHP